MATIREAVRAGGAKGLPRSLKRFYELLADGLVDYLQPGVFYPAAMFTVAATPQYLSLAPWDGEITSVAFVVARAITGGPSDVEYKIDGGSAIATLSTGAGTQGLIVTEVFPTPIPFDEGELLTAESDGTPTGNSEVTVFANVRSRVG